MLKNRSTTGKVIISPLKTLEDLMCWTLSVREKYCQSRIAPVNTTKSRNEKLLICHDMQGGYLNDSYINGCLSADCYHFSHWWMADLFVYFSHYFITIPPPCWVDAAHRHGVLVLGTVITEHAQGIEICTKLLQDQTTREAVADKLVEITELYCFDGWLLNFENEVTDTEALMNFVFLVTSKMHRSNSLSKVIWYDSVTKDGELKWQDELNEKNCKFFDLTDGIFLNYAWNAEKLNHSSSFAGDRRHDVYVGVDVFGRGCFGGGGFNTCEAVEVINNHDLSTAIFAPGWTYEERDSESFEQREEKFWNCLENCFRERKVTSLPLVTSFCRGWGERYYHNGQLLQDIPWTNLSHQQLQPNCSSTHVSMTTDDAFRGGSCLKIVSSDCTVSDIRVFSTDIAVDMEIQLSVTYKLPTDISCRCKVTLSFAGSVDERSYTLQSDDVTVLRQHNNWCTQKFAIPDSEGTKLTAVSIRIENLQQQRCCSEVSMLLGELKLLSGSNIAGDKSLCAAVTELKVLNADLKLSKSDSKTIVELVWQLPDMISSGVSQGHLFIKTLTSDGRRLLGVLTVSCYTDELTDHVDVLQSSQFELELISWTGVSLPCLQLNTAS